MTTKMKELVVQDVLLCRAVTFLALIAVVSCFLLIPCSPAAADIIHVPVDAPTIQVGIDAAQDGDTVLVADGTYTGEGNRDIDLQGKAITVISENGPANCIIDLEEGEYRGFDVFRGEGGGTVIDGFTITGGRVVDLWESGGGIRMTGSSPVIRGNSIIGNSGWNGGGVSCLDGSDPLIEGNTIAGNLGVNAGGGIYARDSSPVICENYVLDNQSGFAGVDGAGGGIYCGNHTLVQNNVISENYAKPAEWGIAWSWGGGIAAQNSAIVSGNLITDNWSSEAGGGIFCTGTTLIAGNIVENTRRGYFTSIGSAIAAGDAIFGMEVEAVITHNIVRNNNTHGIECSGANLVANNLVVDNEGCGLYCRGETTVASCTVATNGSVGFYSFIGSTILVTDSIFWGNDPGDRIQFKFDSLEALPSTLNIAYSDVEGGEAAVDLGQEPQHNSVDWGPGMIDADPLFAGIADEYYYLGQVGAGQPANSPCVNTGSGAAADLCFPAGTIDTCMNRLTTRTDLVRDQTLVDMGYHHVADISAPETVITGGPTGTIDSPTVTFSVTGVDDIDPPGALQYAYRLDDDPWSWYSSATLITISGLEEGEHVFAVRARDSAGNVDSTPAESDFAYSVWDDTDLWRHLVTGPGPGPINPPLVRTELAEWLAYSVMKYGVNVAAGDIDGDGTDEVITGPGPGQSFGPHVRCFGPHGQVVDGAGFLAYGTHKFGVNVAAGDIDGDGLDEIVTGAGPGPVFGPHVRAWNWDGGPESQPIPQVSFFAYGTPKWGVNVACGDIDGDGIDEIVTGAGPGPVYGPHVRAWNWDGSGTVSSIPEVSFLAYGTNQYGVNVACGDLDDDGFEEIITGAGPSPAFGPHVRGWDWDGSGGVVSMPEVNLMAYSNYEHGVVVASGDVNNDGRDDLITMPGPGPDNWAELRAWQYVDGSVEDITSFYSYDLWMYHGGRVAVGNFEAATAPARAAE